MFSVTHFRFEFMQQSQAAILRKVTMTQFMLVICLTALGIGLGHAPFWLAPLFMVAGYVAGQSYQGEILLKRLVAYTIVGGRGLVGAPRIVNVQAEWDQARLQAEQQQIRGLFPTTVVLEG